MKACKYGMAPELEDSSTRIFWDFFNKQACLVFKLYTVVILVLKGFKLYTVVILVQDKCKGVAYNFII